MATFVWILLALGVFVYYGFKEGHPEVPLVIFIVIGSFLLLGGCLKFLGEEGTAAIIWLLVLLWLGYGIYTVATEGSRSEKSRQQREFIEACEKEKLSRLRKELIEAGYNIDKFCMDIPGKKKYPKEGFVCSLERFVEAHHIPLCETHYESTIVEYEEHYDGYRSLSDIYQNILIDQRKDLSAISKGWLVDEISPYLYGHFDSSFCQQLSANLNVEKLRSIFMIYLGFYEDTPESARAKEVKKRMEDAGYYLANSSIVRITFNSSSPMNRLYSETPAKDLYDWECSERIQDFWRNGNSTYRADSLFEKLTGKKIIDFPLPQTENTSFALKVRNFYKVEYVLKSEGFKVDRNVFVKDCINNIYNCLFPSEKEREKAPKIFYDYEVVFYDSIERMVPPPPPPQITSDVQTVTENTKSANVVFKNVLQELRTAGYNVSDKLCVPLRDEKDSSLWEISTNGCIIKDSDQSYKIISSYKDYQLYKFPVECRDLSEVYKKLSEFQKSNLKNIKYGKLYDHLGIFRKGDLSRETLESMFMASLGLDDGSQEIVKANNIKKFMEDSDYRLSSNIIAKIAFDSDSPVCLKSEYTADELYQWVCGECYYSFFNCSYQKLPELDKEFSRLSRISVSTIPLPDAYDGDKMRNLYEADYVLKSEGLEAIKFYSSEFTNTEERKKVFEDYACVFYGAINSANPEADKQSNQL